MSQEGITPTADVSAEPEVDSYFPEPDQGNFEPEPAVESEPVKEESSEAPQIGQNLDQLSNEPEKEEEKQVEPASEEESEVDALRKQLNDLMGAMANMQQPAPIPESPLPEGFTPPKDPSTITNVDFFGEEDHVAVLEDKAKFNHLLNKVMTVAFNASVMAAQEKVTRQIPSLVSTTVQQQSSIDRLTTQFYSANPDLSPYKAAVSMAAQQLYNENPNLEIGDLLAKAGERTREVLKLRQVASRQRVPAQPAGHGGGIDRVQSQGKSELSRQEQQILDLLDF